MKCVHVFVWAIFFSIDKHEINRKLSLYPAPVHSISTTCIYKKEIEQL